MPLSNTPQHTHPSQVVFSSIAYPKFVITIIIIIYIYFFFLLFKPAPEAYGSSRARGQIGVTATSLGHSHSNAGGEPHLRPTPQLMTMLDP